MSKPDYELQRICVRADGYDAEGAYWGTGPDVFIATMDNGAQDITVRATSVSEAREKIAAERARPLGTPRATPRETIGGTSPNKSRYEIDWCDPVCGAHVRLHITHARDYLAQGQDHIEVESIAPRKTPLPITETGYRSHFINPLELVNAGGTVTFVTAWLDREAKGKAWQQQHARRSQGDLFSWADAQTEVGKRGNSKRPPRSKPSAPKAIRKGDGVPSRRRKAAPAPK